MEIASQEDPVPINTGGGGHGHMIHHLHHHHHHANSAASSLNIPTSNPLIASSNGNGLSKNHDHPHHHDVGYNILTNNNKKDKSVVKYKECMKNHAASMGGNAIDGCGEFMPSGEEGSIEALICSACNCHRNFHRREIEGEEKPLYTPYHYQQPQPPMKLMFHHHHKMTKSPLPQQMIMPIGVATAGSNSESEDLMEEDGGGSLTFPQPPPPPPPPYSYGAGHSQKKRFRTKFTQEQKEKMLSFAERVGWKIQRQEESVVQQFCQEIGVRRRVLKVWMHNNKHNLSSKKSNSVSDNLELSGGNNDFNNAATRNLASTSP